METDLGRIRAYRIFAQYPNGKCVEITVEGYRVVILGFEEYEFFVHKSHVFDDGNWRISEASTGFAFPDECNALTRQKTIDNATALLNVKGKPKFDDVISKTRKYREIHLIK